MKHVPFVLLLLTLLLPLAGLAQVNSGSDGHDGALNPANNLVIDMADHPDGIYHYTSVNIPAGVAVSFIPNAGNKPVVWLVQGSCVIAGYIAANGETPPGATGGVGGPGGFAGGHGGTLPVDGQGPGGGKGYKPVGGNGSHATVGERLSGDVQGQAGVVYGNSFCLPLYGGSGGGGGDWGGGGGGGAMLIAANFAIRLDGYIVAYGASGHYESFGTSGGGGAGGSIRLMATNISGGGGITVTPGFAAKWGNGSSNAGKGRVRIDSYSNNFGGYIDGNFTQGFQPLIIPATGQGIQLGIQSLAGVAVAASPSGVLANPDVIIPAQQANPIPIVVRCTNLPLNTEISVVVHPANGPDVQAVGLNNAGTVASSTATVSLNMPRGGGIIYAKAVTGIAGVASVEAGAGEKFAEAGAPPPAREARALPGRKMPSLAETGWTADGERFVKMEITAALGGKQSIAYITESGKRYPAN